MAIFPTDFTTKSTPAVSGDYILISDGEDGNQVKKIDTNLFMGPVGPEGPAGPVGSISGIGQVVNVNDLVKSTGSTTTYSDSQLWIKITRADGTYTLYTATGNTHPYSIASGIYEYDYNNNQLSATPMAGTYSATTHSITYSNGNNVNGTTGDTQVAKGNIAYVNQTNNFLEVNNFNKDTNFKGRVAFPYYPMTLNTSDIVFDANNGSKQYISVGAGAYTISFTNLRTGSNYEFAIITSGSATLSKGTISTSDTITKFYSIGDSFTNGMSLTADVHLFVCDTFNTAIHISYIGHSREII